ncbi:putative isomerase YddE [wastewater metagenome]|uniref:Putative isomerase YddE n=2 Tax=unclassified sequences TaxID=12908 RepID=A0A5B8RBK0_9ZZZZ|nr:MULTISPECIES: PhzF family phenazine biosynthesis protein [Arhodomonas]QEA05453.1 putative isomerase YddE [uncultured organism]
MQAVPIIQVDAFTATAFGGVACAVVLDADGLDDEMMSTLSDELGVSATVFAMDPEDQTVAEVGARSFVGREEVPLFGHLAVALTHALLTKGRLARGDGHIQRLGIETNHGVVEMDVTHSGGDMPLLSVTQPPPDFFEAQDPAEIATVFGLELSDLRDDAPVQTVNTVIPHLMVPVVSEDALRRARVRLDAYAELHRFGGFVGAHLFALGGATDSGDVFSRHFGAPPNAFEHSFNGSASGGLAAYLWHHGLIPHARFSVEQGHWLGRPGEAWVEVQGEPEAIRGVRVAGRAVQVMEGLMLVPDTGDGDDG